MKPVKFQEANMTLVAPKGMENEVEDLVCCKTDDGNGNSLIVTKWELSPEEIAEVIKTKSVYCIVLGQSQPPLSLHAHNVFSPIVPLQETPTKIIKLNEN